MDVRNNSVSMFSHPSNLHTALKEVKKEQRLRFLDTTLGDNPFALFTECTWFGSVLAHLESDDMAQWLKKGNSELPRILPTGKEVIEVLDGLM